MEPFILLVAGLGLFYFERKRAQSVAAAVAAAPFAINVTDLAAKPPVKSPTPAGPAASLPPLPSIGHTIVFVQPPQWFVPIDDLTPTGIVKSRELTIRQIQAAFNMLGAQLVVDGNWTMPTKQAVWDFQYIHQKDNPSNPLNVTGEIDQLTENAIISAVGNKAGLQTGFY
jgi:hypothetical protein